MRALLATGDSNPSVAGGAESSARSKSRSYFPSSSSLFKSSGTSGAPDYEFASSRFVPPLKGLAMDMAGDRLSEKAWPPLEHQASAADRRPTATSTRVKSSWGGAKQAANFTGGRCIIFIGGGVTYAEIAAAAEASAQTNKEVIVGGTSIINPKDYLSGLRAM
mmetsp:Transcript_15478/g.36143  ORF Transcript_15478/g.36143 Transcript_15478/m.36143 type:complete len:163 (-) Transcript_15478:332-820(-)